MVSRKNLIEDRTQSAEHHQITDILEWVDDDIPPVIAEELREAGDIEGIAGSEAQSQSHLCLRKEYDEVDTIPQ